MQRGEIYTVLIDKFVFEGKGIGAIQTDDPALQEAEGGRKIFVPFAYPGDLVKVEIQKVKKNFAEGFIKELITASQSRVSPRCKYYTHCGGCKQQDLVYPLQTAFKQQQVAEIFMYMGGFNDFKFHNIIPSERVFFYRNKMEYSFSNMKWLPPEEFLLADKQKSGAALGLHVPGAYNKIINMDECFLQSEESNTILRKTAEFFFAKGTSIYDNKPNEGYLRNLVIKQSSHTPDLMVNLVTFTRDEDMMKEYTEFILKEVPQITTVVNNINSRKAMVATGDVEYADFGSGFIYDKIGDCTFRISANSFFQTNTFQAEHLYNVAKNFAGFTGDEIVYDLYCGAGTITLFNASSVKQMYGFEVTPSSIEDAEINKSLNNATNVEFFTADLYKSFLPAVESAGIPKPDIIIADPPRSGMHENTVKDILALSPKKIVYISCNPTTQVRDVKEFVNNGYTLKEVQPVDMFPHTFHIENVVLLVQE